MVDALVLEASTSVCGFESHLPHQKKRAPKGAFFFCCQGIWHSQMPPAAAGTSASLHVWQEPAVPPHAPSLFCDTIQFAIETDRSCHRQGPGAKSCSGLFLCSKFVAPVPADLNLPGSKKAPGGAFFCFVPPASPRQPFPNPCRRAALRNYSLFTCPAPAFPSHFPGAPENRPPQGRRISSPAAMRDCKTPFPPACRAQAHSEPVPQSGTPKLFSIPSSLAQPCLFFPPERTAKQKYILFFGHLTHNSDRYNIGLNLIMEGKEYGKTGSA